MSFSDDCNHTWINQNRNSPQTMRNRELPVRDQKTARWVEDTLTKKGPSSNYRAPSPLHQWSKKVQLGRDFRRAEHCPGEKESFACN